ncbi:solute carrier family 22 member 21 isoform X2 [Aethina tumida]|uniref:solute carrier family 22 member 21 isoform X2 n=1 Tax=Aethina tumida TaxID=116153 RepID=UPI0021474A0E|nr:solute carrier family 22 member 21 isoform X2 [Aethina tumida]
MQGSAIYDEILLEVNNDGQFQKYYNYKYNIVFVVLASMTYFSYVLMLAVPDVWCAPPEVYKSNYTDNEWKIKHIPWNSDKNKYESCLMYGFNNTTISCQNGFEYDTTWFEETIPSKENWVCEDTMKVTHAFELSRVGEILGTFIFGYMGDKFGRRSVFYISLTTLLLGRLSMIITSGYYPLFLISLVVGSLFSNNGFQAILIIGFETTKDENRSLMSFVQCTSWTVGICMIPLVYWYFKRWIPVLIIPSVPLIGFYFFRGYMIESPRWLANKGKIDRALKQLKEIRKINKTSLSSELVSNLRSLKKIDEETSSSLLNLFKNKTIAKITIISIFTWACCNLVYVILYLNATNLRGNPYMNFFWQCLAELPGYAIGKYASDFLGRKLSRIFSFALIGVGCLLSTVIVLDSRFTLLVTIIAILMKVAICTCYYCVSLHTLEIYPTNMRQSGSSIGFLAGNAASILAPSVIHLGITMDARIPYVVIMCISFAAAIFTFGLPETLNNKLPETIQEVEEIIKTQKFYTFRQLKTNEICDNNSHLKNEL